MNSRLQPNDPSDRSPLSVRLPVQVAAVLLRRQRQELDQTTRREILGVLAARLLDVQAARSWPGYVVRATREIVALTSLAATRREEGLGGWRGWTDDAALAAKGLLRRPAFSVTAVLILALGIGAGTAAFSVIDSVMFRTPEYDRDRTLAVIWKELHGGAFQISGHSREEIELYREAESFAAVAASTSDNVSVYDGERATRRSSRSTDLHFLPMLGIEPVLGRWFEEQDLGADRVLISESMWTDGYGRDPDVLGRLVEVDGTPREIVGVLPNSVSRISLNSRTDLWLPLDLGPELERFTLHALVRLRPGVEPQAAEAELESLMAAKLEQRADDPPMKTLVRRKHDDRVPGDTASTLWMIFGGVGLLLLTSCANASSLALTRDANRAQDLGTRLALGASPSRVVRYLGMEGVLLGVVAACVGGLASWQALPALMRFAPDQVRTLMDAGGHGSHRTTLFLLLVSLMTACLVAVLPILRFRLRARRARRAAVGDSRSTRRWGTALVTGQVATAFVLLMASSLLLRSFERRMSVEPGYALDRLQATVQIPPGVDTPEAATAFFDQVKEQTLAISGLRHASWADAPTQPPIFGGIDFAVDGEPREVGRAGGLLPAFTGDPDMFAALGIGLVSGRGFDRDDPREVIVIGRSLADALFGDQDPVGRSLRLSEDVGAYTIIGVAENLMAAGPEEPLGPWEVYRPIGSHRAGALTLILAFDEDPMSRLSEVRAAVAEVDPRAAVDRMETLGVSWNASMERSRFLVEMVVVIAALTLALTLFGLYSVLSYAVAQRRREIGLRMALGAGVAGVRWLVVRQSAVAVLSGLGLGGVVAWIFRKGLEAQLFETAVTDLWSVAGAMFLLLLAAMVASWVPAARATRIEPSKTLRNDA